MFDKLLNNSEADASAVSVTCQRNSGKDDKRKENLLASRDEDDLPTQVWDIRVRVKPTRKECAHEYALGVSRGDTTGSR